MAKVKYIKLSNALEMLQKTDGGKRETENRRGNVTI